jgi:DNA-binding transcriptional LysR family regulator
MPFDARLLSGVSILSAVVEAGNFVRAAELLNMTPSGVSHGVARLEARVGARLFNRTTRALHLTDEGRRLYERVSPLLGEIEEAANEASGATEIVRGRLRVNVDPFFSRLVLAAHLAAFLQNDPQLRLSRLRLVNQRIGFLRFAAAVDLHGVWHGWEVSGCGER